MGLSGGCFLFYVDSAALIDVLIVSSRTDKEMPQVLLTEWKCVDGVEMSSAKAMRM